MTRIGFAASVLGGLLTLVGCGGGTTASPGPDSELAATSELRVVEITTVNTVQGSSGVFLSPRPSVAPPAYLERGSAARSVSFPATVSTLDRAKLDTTLLFRADAPGSKRWHLDARLAPRESGTALPSLEHFFPKLRSAETSAHWPLELSQLDGDPLPSDGSSEWSGWRAFPGLGVTSSAEPTLVAAAATLDFETLGMSAPLLLSSNGETMMVTNRSGQVIHDALLIYTHPGGIGVRLVPELAPGQQEVTTTGPKEGPLAEQLNEARLQLTEYFSQTLGSELGTAVAQAKSVPFLETQGLRLVYLREDLQIPAQITFSEAVAEHRRVVISQAEVFLQTAEADALRALSGSGTLDRTRAVGLLGRFTQAKLEYATVSGDAQVSAASSELLAELAVEASH